MGTIDGRPTVAAYPESTPDAVPPDTRPEPLMGIRKSDALALVDRAFTYHAPKEDQIPRYRDIRDQARDFALIITDLTPPGPEQTLALRKIQEAVMWANAAIACGEA